MNEFELINQYFKKPNQRLDVLLGIGDDCALLSVPEGQNLAISIDTSVAGVHFPLNTAPYAIGYKSLAVSLSDLAAMGAEPAWVTLSLTLPDANAAWLEEFTKGFFDLAKQYKVALIGGDTTRGPLSVTTQVHGFIPKSQAIKRSGAKAGDGLFVSGTLGEAGLGLKVAQRELDLPKPLASQVLARLNTPIPRVEMGMALRGIASSALDISDGLVGDLEHVLTASKVGATIWLEHLPIVSMPSYLSIDHAIALALYAGDDYELCFTAPVDRLSDLELIAKNTGISVTQIGVIETDPGLRLCSKDGELKPPEYHGYRHF